MNGGAKIQGNKDNCYYYYYYYYYYYTTNKSIYTWVQAGGLEIKKNRAKKRNRVMNVKARISIYLFIYFKKKIKIG